jgi:hypothetical protein
VIYPLKVRREKAEVKFIFSTTYSLRHFDKLSNNLVCHDNVDDLSSSDTQLIAECQPLGDNVSWDQLTWARTAAFKGGVRYRIL